ncbi:PAAR domain-containing protein [Oxalobacteraceae bacterium OTU3REALA1]|nr:PAAR domain-containing protein [Oxalobacteraceae bacterium OTU3REALA1]
MMRAVICKGDPTSHGGKVLEGNELVTTNGRAVAQKGHMTFCPQCKGNFPIAEGLDFHTYAGIGTAVDGMKTACGAKLIATQNQMVIDDGGGGGGAGDGDSGGKGMAAEPAAKPGSEATPPESKRDKYGASFRAVDERTGNPVAGMPYRMVTSDGRTVRGVTDNDGRTQTVTGHDPATVQLFWEVEDIGDGNEGR